MLQFYLLLDEFTTIVPNGVQHFHCIPHSTNCVAGSNLKVASDTGQRFRLSDPWATLLLTHTGNTSDIESDDYSPVRDRLP
jgi:hypothetical protein